MGLSGSEVRYLIGWAVSSNEGRRRHLDGNVLGMLAKGADSLRVEIRPPLDWSEELGESCDEGALER